MINEENNAEDVLSFKSHTSKKKNKNFSPSGLKWHEYSFYFIFFLGRVYSHAPKTTNCGGHFSSVKIVKQYAGEICSYL